MDPNPKVMQASARADRMKALRVLVWEYVAFEKASESFPNDDGA